jgi:hypothetical protein
MAVIKIVPMPGAKGAKGDEGETGSQGPQGETGLQGPAGADALWSYNGSWQSNASYAEGDVVTYDGQLYYATGVTTLGTTPDVDNSFDLIAVKGADGTPGESGVSEETSFIVNGGTTGTQPTFDGDPLFSGSYIRIGDLINFQIQVDMDNITSFGTGQYYVDLPFPAKYGYKFREGCLHDISTGVDYAIGGHVFAGESRLLLSSTDAQGNTAFDIAFTSTSPVLLDVADNFHISGTYISE